LKLIVTSTRDLASVKVREVLESLVSFEDAGRRFNGEPVLRAGDVLLVTVDCDLLYADHVDQLGAELAVFASRHESASRLPSLLVHVPGNWTSKAEAGGRPRALCRCRASAVKEALLELEAQRRRLGLDGWLCGVEATHHGPYLEATPALFVEVGSSESEWGDERAAEAAARAILRAVRSSASYRALIGIGGPHYAPKFTRIMLETEWAVGHIAPKYVLSELDEELLAQAISRCEGGVEGAVIDWKGVRGEDRARVLDLLDRLGVKAYRDDDLLG